MRILMFSDDPDTNLSYGHQMRMLIDSISENHEIHYSSAQMDVGGNPIKRENFTKWGSGWNAGSRIPHDMNMVLEAVKPEVFFTHYDLQNTEWVKSFLRQSSNNYTPWVGWFPWDNHEKSYGAVSNIVQCVRKMDVPVVVSKFGQEYFADKNIQVGQIYNMVDTSTFKPTEVNPEIREKNDFLDDKFIFLFVGRPNWRKKLEILFVAIKELLNRGRKDFVLYLHTDFRDPAATFNLDTFIHALGINNHVVRTINYDWRRSFAVEDLVQMYNMADVYVTSHAGEGMGLPIVEAMACEVPFIATNCTTTPEFAGEEERGLAIRVGREIKDRGIMRPLADTIDLVDKMEYMMDNPSEVKKMGRRGREWVVDNCSRDVVIDQWKTLLGRLDMKRVFIE